MTSNQDTIKGLHFREERRDGPFYTVMIRDPLRKKLKPFHAYASEL